jgi:putative hemolysin
MFSRTGIFVILGACIVAGMLIAGCTSQQTTAAVPTTVITTAAPEATPSAAATPATNETVAVSATETAANATAVNATEPAASTGIANPASVNCAALNGTTEIKTAADGGQYGMCTFANGTSCEEWALFHGEGCKAGIDANATAVNATTTESK